MEGFGNKLGLHWIVDATDCAFDALGDEAHLENVLVSIPDQLGLTRVGQVQLFQHEEEDGDITLAGMVLIAESHFSIHARPGLRTLHADLFSCKPFDIPAARRLLKAAFGFTQYEESVLERGKIEEGRVG